ncbi:hypothetical protein ABK040_012518 [Willaertia magna]
MSRQVFNSILLVTVGVLLFLLQQQYLSTVVVVNAQHFIGTEISPAYTCGDVLNYMLKNKLTSPPPNLRFKRRFITARERTYSTNCVFDIDRKIAWTEIYKITAPRTFDILDGAVEQLVMDGSIWSNVDRVENSYITKTPAYIEVPFSLIKLTLGSKSKDFGLSGNAHGASTSADWKVASLYHVYNKKEGTGDGTPVNIKILSDYSLATWKDLSGLTNIAETGCTAIAGFRLQDEVQVTTNPFPDRSRAFIPITKPITTTIVETPGVLFGFYLNKRDILDTTNINIIGRSFSCHSAAFHLIGTGFGSSQAFFQPGYTKLFQGAVLGGNVNSNVEVENYNQAFEMQGGVSVSEGVLDCEAKDFCSLNGRCISSDGVCDCLYAWSGDPKCSTPVYNRQDLLIYLKDGSYKSLTNTFHAMNEENVLYDDLSKSFMFNPSFGRYGIGKPHLTFGSYSEPFSLSNDFTIAFKFKTSDYLSLSPVRYYVISYSSISNIGKPSTEFKLYFSKTAAEDNVSFQFGTIGEGTIRFGAGTMLNSDFKWIIFRRKFGNTINISSKTVQLTSDSGVFFNYNIRAPGLFIVGSSAEDYDLYGNGITKGFYGSISNLMVFNRYITDYEARLIFNETPFCFGSNGADSCNGVNVCTDYNICNCPSPFKGQNCHLFQQGTVVTRDGNGNVYGVVGTSKSISLSYTYPFDGSLGTVLLGTFHCGFGGNYFAGATPQFGTNFFTCSFIVEQVYDGLPIHLYYKSPNSLTHQQVSSNSSITFYSLSAGLKLNLNYYYWVPIRAITGMKASVGTPINSITTLKVLDRPYQHLSTVMNTDFFYGDIQNYFSTPTRADSVKARVEFVVSGEVVTSTFIYLFGMGNPKYGSDSFNALKVSTNTSIVIKELGFNLFEEMKAMLHCSFDSKQFFPLKYDSVNTNYNCMVQSSTTGEKELQIYARGDNGAMGAVSLTSKYVYIYKKDNINYEGRLIFNVNVGGTSFTINLSQYSIMPASSKVDLVKSRIKCLVNGTLTETNTVSLNGTSIGSVTCDVAFPQEGIYSLNVVHDNLPGYLLLSDNDINFYTFSPRALSPSKIARLVHSSGTVAISVVGDGLPYDATAYKYQFTLNGNTLIFMPEITNGLITKFYLTLPSFAEEFYGSIIRLSVTKGNHVVYLSEIEFSIVSQKSIILSGNNRYVLIGKDSNLQFALNDTSIPSNVISGFFCEYNSTNYFAVQIINNNILSCTISGIGAIPGRYPLKLVSGDLFSKISVNSLNIYAFGNYGIKYYSPSILPQNLSHFYAKVVTSNNQAAFFDFDTSIRFYFNNSLSAEMLPIDISVSPPNEITLTCSSKLMNSQQFSLVLSFEEQHYFTLNTFSIYPLNDALLPLKLHASSDIVELVNNNATVKLETTGYTLQGMTSPFVKCRASGIPYFVDVISNTLYPNVITCSFNFNNNGYKAISLVYDDSLNTMFNLTSSLDFPIIDPQIGRYLLPTNTLQTVGLILETSILSNTWLPIYLQNNISCSGDESLTIISTQMPIQNGEGKQEIICQTKGSMAYDYKLTLTVTVNRETQRKINLISNELPIQFIPTYANTTLIKIEPRLALLGKSFQPIFYVNQAIAISTVTSDFKCIVSKKNSDTILVDTLAVKYNNDLTFICSPIIINSIGEQYAGNYLVRLVVASRMNPNNVIDIFNTPTIYFVNRRSLQLHPTSPIALPENTKLNTTLYNFLSSVTLDYSEIKFVIGGNNYSLSQFTAETIGIYNGPTLSTGGYMPIEIWFKSLISSAFDFPFSSNSFQFPFIQQNTLSFNTSFVNGAYINQQFISKLRYSGFLGINSPPITTAPSLHGRVYCVIGNYIVKATQYDYFDNNTAEFECNLKYSNKGVINGGLFLDTNNGYIKLQNIDLFLLLR